MLAQVREFPEEVGAGSWEFTLSLNAQCCWDTPLSSWLSSWLSELVGGKLKRQEKGLITRLLPRASHSEKATHRFKLITLVPAMCVHKPSSGNSHGKATTVVLSE